MDETSKSGTEPPEHGEPSVQSVLEGGTARITVEGELTGAARRRAAAEKFHSCRFTPSFNGGNLQLLLEVLATSGSENDRPHDTASGGS